MREDQDLPAPRRSLRLFLCGDVMWHIVDLDQRSFPERRDPHFGMHG